MTPYEIELLLHIYAKWQEVPRKPPIYYTTIEKFLFVGVIEVCQTSPTGFKVTDHGLTIVGRLRAVSLNPDDELPMPEDAIEVRIGQKWKHHNGVEYQVINITNVDTTKPNEYPVTVIYRGANAKVWSRPLSKWHQSMTLVYG